MLILEILKSEIVRYEYIAIMIIGSNIYTDITIINTLSTLIWYYI